MERIFSRCRNRQTCGVLGISKHKTDKGTYDDLRCNTAIRFAAGCDFPDLVVPHHQHARSHETVDRGWRQPELLRRIRQHGNFIEWACFVLILMILAEGIGAPAMYLHITGALLLIGRMAHPFGLKIDNSGHPLRYVCNGTYILATLNIMVCLAVNILGL